jgi:hypothetical protein
MSLHHRLSTEPKQCLHSPNKRPQTSRFRTSSFDRGKDSYYSDWSPQSFQLSSVVPLETDPEITTSLWQLVSMEGRKDTKIPHLKRGLKASPTALRDAIKAHRSLYLTGKILHRGISENNIIITDPEKADGFTGMLIDLDLAKEVGTDPSGARHKTGTMEFMAIEVLRQIDHTYRHDLESFFYVLLWICARRTWDSEFECNKKHRPQKSILQNWYTGSYKEIARSKQGDMHIDGFEDILDEFPYR